MMNSSLIIRLTLFFQFVSTLSFFFFKKSLVEWLLGENNYFERLQRRQMWVYLGKQIISKLVQCVIEVLS